MYEHKGLKTKKTQPKVGPIMNPFIVFSHFKHKASFKQYLKTKTHSQFVDFLQAEK